MYQVYEIALNMRFEPVTVLTSIFHQVLEIRQYTKFFEPNSFPFKKLLQQSPGYFPFWEKTASARQDIFRLPWVSCVWAWSSSIKKKQVQQSPVYFLFCAFFGYIQKRLFQRCMVYSSPLFKPFFGYIKETVPAMQDISVPQLLLSLIQFNQEETATTISCVFSVLVTSSKDCYSDAGIFTLPQVWSPPCIRHKQFPHKRWVLRSKREDGSATPVTGDRMKLSTTRTRYTGVKSGPFNHLIYVRTPGARATWADTQILHHSLRHTKTRKNHLPKYLHGNAALHSIQ